MYAGLHVKYGLLWSVFNWKLEFSRQIWGKSSNIKLHKYPSSRSRVVPCGQTDRNAKLIVASRNFSNAPKIPTWYFSGSLQVLEIRILVTSVHFPQNIFYSPFEYHRTIAENIHRPHRWFWWTLSMSCMFAPKNCDVFSSDIAAEVERYDGTVYIL